MILIGAVAFRRIIFDGFLKRLIVRCRVSHCGADGDGTVIMNACALPGYIRHIELLGDKKKIEKADSLSPKSSKNFT